MRDEPSFSVCMAKISHISVSIKLETDVIQYIWSVPQQPFVLHGPLTTIW